MSARAVVTAPEALRRTPAGGRRLSAILLAGIVTLLWSSSYILIKIGLQGLPPLTFAGLRYFAAFLALLLAYPIRGRAWPRRPGGAAWRALVGLGLTTYAIVPAAMFVSLKLLPVNSTNLIFQAGIPLTVALLSGLVLNEPTSLRQWIGVLLTVAGIYLFFPALPEGGEALGAGLALVAAVGGAAGNLLTRHLMRDHPLRAGDVSMISMGIGSTLLLLVSRFVEPFPTLTWSSVALLLWLSLINTALAFTLWNLALRTLTALEGGVIANAQIVEVALMAWFILGEQLAGIRIVAALVILLGVTLVQWRRPAVAVEAGSLGSGQ
ncbi:MAG TPA: DMT family transporter [Anaerolineales bacterium]|nr:DMT family transporter [Anaerolineales bacterium]